MKIKKDGISECIKLLRVIPGVGNSIAKDLVNIGIFSVNDLKGKNPEVLYRQSNEYAGIVQDRCLLYVFRCAVYFAENKKHDPEKLKWWNWSDNSKKRESKVLKEANW